MTPDDWHRGMDNEAASVDDMDWARETRREAQRLQRQGALQATLVFALMGLAQVVLLHVYWQDNPPTQLWLGVMGAIAVATAALALGRRGLKPLVVASAALAYLPGAWLAVLLLQGLLGDVAPRSPGFTDGEVTVLAAIAAGVMILMARVTSRRTPA